MIRDNWRVLVLIGLLVASALALFVPGVGLGTAPTEEGKLTNLQYGLDLDSGTKIEATLVGVTATGVDIGNRSPRDVEEAVAGSLERADPGDVAVRAPTERRPEVAIEVTANVTTQALAGALDDAGIAHDDVRRGVTAETREETLRVLRTKINEAGLSGARVQAINSPGQGRQFVRLTVPQQNRSTVVDLVNTRGEVEILAYHPVSANGTTTFENRTVLTNEDFQEIGIAQRGDRVGPHVPVVIRSSDVDGDGVPEHEAFQQAMDETGIATSGGTTCGWPGGEGPCLLTVVDGEVVYSAGMDEDLGRSMVQGTWVNDPSFILVTTDIAEARELSIHLRAGALPATLDLENANIQRVPASLGERFRIYSLVIGIITVLAVALTVFVRYGDPRVAAPMVVTALSEVVILLGFAAAVGIPLDLSHIAGLIAVIGTGVDDLIIIADEVMAEGSVSSYRVFQSRFRKAFWVIGVAAMTTIIAMTPIAAPVLALGDLRGFAIITILGVLVGVLITRPAYGDILRSILTDT